MTYATFLENVRFSVQEKLGSGYHVGLHQVLKNNGLLLDGLSILSPGAALAPTIYVNSYYDEAENGISLADIAQQIILLYREQKGCSPEFYDHLGSLDGIKNKVAYKLINASENEHLLADIPSFPFLDLAVVFYLMISENHDGQMTALIHNQHLELWDISKDTLLSLAEQNTPGLFPHRILPIEEALFESGMQRDCAGLFAEQPTIYLSVLTNQKGINGASCILYKDVIKNFAEQEKDDIVILPSSIHEVLLTPYKKAFPYGELNEMISLINDSDVPPEDRLSDHIYLYSREQNCITIPVFPKTQNKEQYYPQ